MTRGDLVALLPFIILAVGVLSVMLSIAFYRRPAFAAGLSLACLAGAFSSLFAGSSDRHAVFDLLVMDRYAHYFIGLLTASALVTGLLSALRHPGEKTVPEEFYCLLLLGTLGGAVFAASSHGASLLLGLETLSVSLYAMIAYQRTKPDALEAAIKYLVLASTSSAILIFGLALLYAATGSLDISHWVGSHGKLDLISSSLLGVGGVLVVVGAGFKLAAFPFHMWTPDVYQASSEPVAAFIATASKGAMIAFLLRFAISTGGFAADGVLAPVVTAVAVLSMLAGNLLALLQDDLRRLLAYSSVAHMGYLLVAILAAGKDGDSGAVATGYYLAAYFPAMLAAFGVLSALQQIGRNVVTLEDLHGLARERPFAAVVLTTSFLSLAGLPLTSGFMGKLYVVTSGVEANAWSLITALVIGTAIGIYYYLRVISAMCASRTAAAKIIALPTRVQHPSRSVAAALLALLTILIFWLGVQPLPLLTLLEAPIHHEPETSAFSLNLRPLAP